MERGLRQGDPLAPFLFLVVAECLHLLVEEAVARGLLKELKWCFFAVSGLKVNLSKSKVYGIGVKEEEVKSWASSVGCGAGKLPLIYLGLPVGASMRSCSNWLPVVKKMKKKLAGWKAKLFSFGGRLTLTKSVLGSLSLYYFSLFRAPVSVLNLLERLRKSFFWGGGGGGSRDLGDRTRGCHWVKWSKVLGSFEFGGLNVGSLKESNWSLLCKWWWRFRVEEGALWVKVIKSIFGEDGGLVKIDRSTGGGGASVWGNIVKVGLEVDKLEIPFTNSVGKVIGDEVNENTSIAGRGEFEGEEWRWRWGWRRDPRGREIGELEGLMKELEGFCPKTCVSDRVVWNLDPSGEFSVKALRRLLEVVDRRGSGVSNIPTMWLKEIPKKVCLFMWRVRLGRMPVRVELVVRGHLAIARLLVWRRQTLKSTLIFNSVESGGARFGISRSPNSYCVDFVHFSRESESVEHALFGCGEVKGLWKLIGEWWNVNVNGCNSLSDLCSLGNQEGVGLKSFEWVNRRNKEITVDWRTWLLDPFDTSDFVSFLPLLQMDFREVELFQILLLGQIIVKYSCSCCSMRERVEHMYRFGREGQFCKGWDSVAVSATVSSLV
ncbi:hypothetical protein OSB04_010496 [Centaurea solstitialis]|uniref:Reverse transcriptase zinc-binding domain-containing protein n=1 Tax=Centaurea solstitialis TaxID=347529 RepID=A0AA38TQS6_9ASTR|nr:hypothetical protein OSB04_010496 [Centaurea solstitialis]